MENLYYTYVLYNKEDDFHYYGHSKDLDERLDQHSRRRVQSTKGHRSLKLIYKEAFKTKSEAFKQEMFFKSIEGYRYLKNKGII